MYTPTFLTPYKASLELLATGDLDPIFRRRAVARSIRSSPLLEDYGVLFDHTPLDEDSGLSRGVRLKGSPIGDGTYTLALTYCGGYGYEPFCIMGLDYDYTGFKITQFQGLTRSDEPSNIRDPQLNRRLISKFKWDHLLLDIFEHEILGNSPYSTYVISGGKNNKWLLDTYELCSGVDLGIGMLSFDEFMSLTDKQFYSMMGPTLDRLVREECFGLSYQEGRELVETTYIHLTPERALKRYDILAKSRGGVQLMCGDYLMEVSEEDARTN